MTIATIAMTYHLNDYTALRDLKAYFKFASRGETGGEEAQEERSEIWGHVKALRRRVASLN